MGAYRTFKRVKPDQVLRIRKLLRSGLSLRKTADAMGLGKTTIERWRNKLGLRTARVSDVDIGIKILGDPPQLKIEAVCASAADAAHLINAIRANSDAIFEDNIVFPGSEEYIDLPELPARRKPTGSFMPQKKAA